MKMRLLLSAVIVAAVMTLTECGPDKSSPLPTTPKDTTKTKVYNNQFKIGFEIYKLDIVEDLSTSTYFPTSDETVIYVTGNSSKDVSSGVVEGNATFEIIIKGQGTNKGIYKQTDLSPGEITLEVTTGSPPKLSEYSFDTKSNIIVEITEYGKEGGIVKGTFSGILKDGLNTGAVSGGLFEVKRAPNK
jgi:hypothetical protein